MTKRRRNRWKDSWLLGELTTRISYSVELTCRGYWYMRWKPWGVFLFSGGGYADIFLKGKVRKTTLDGKWK